MHMRRVGHEKLILMPFVLPAGSEWGQWGGGVQPKGVCVQSSAIHRGACTWRWGVGMAGIYMEGVSIRKSYVRSLLVPLCDLNGD